MAIDRLLAEVFGIARRAGHEILTRYETGVDSWEKEDRSPVTEADLAAESVILPALEALETGIPIVSEERVSREGLPDISGRQFWLVDPLDGTKEFLNRNGEFTVNIALINDGQPVLGVVHVPALDESYGGAAGGLALRVRGSGAPEPIKARVPDPDGLVAMVSRSHKDPAALDRFFDGVAVKDRLDAGSSLKFCRVAEGSADIYPRLGPTMEWDTAAGHAVLAGAGGGVSDLDGAPLRYGKVDFRNPHFIARGLTG